MRRVFIDFTRLVKEFICLVLWKEKVFMLLFVAFVVFEGNAQSWNVAGRNANTMLDGVKIVVTTTSPDGFERTVMNPSGGSFWSPSSVAGSNAIKSIYKWDNTINFEFRDPSTNQLVEVIDPVIHVDHVGGIQHVITSWLWITSVVSTSYSCLLTLEGGLTWSKLKGTTDFELRGANGVYDNSAGERLEGVPVGEAENPSSNDRRYAAAGSLMIRGRVTGFQLRVPHFRGPRARKGDAMRFTFNRLNRFNNTTAVNDNFYTDYGVNLEGNLLANDRDDQGDNQIVTPQEFTTSKGGHVTLFSTGSFVYVPRAGFSGSDSFTYKVCDDWVSKACDIGTVNITIWDFSPPDYYPTLFTGNTIVVGESMNIDFYIVVGEATGHDSNSINPVEVRIADSDSFKFSFEQSLLSINGTNIDNRDWVYKEESGLHKFQYIGNGGIFKGNEFSKIGVNAHFYSPSNSSGKVPLKVTVKSDSGGQTNTNNDNDQDIIEYKFLNRN